MKLKPRIEELKKVYRYGAYTDEMFFRPDLFIHSQRVKFFAKLLLDIIETKTDQSLDENLILALADIHDDEEIITGDYVAYKKLQFSQQEKKEHEKNCRNAINILVSSYGETFGTFQYKDLLQIIHSEDSLEYFIIDLADKLDAHCEVCHELFNGNRGFLKPIFLKGYGDVTPYWFTYYRSKERIEKLEASLGLDVLLEFLSINEEDYIGKYRIKSYEDIKSLKTGYNIYDTWISKNLNLDISLIKQLYEKRK